MKKYLLGILLALFCGLAGYGIAVADFGDLFAVGNDGSGGFLFRITSTGGIVSSGTNTIVGVTGITGATTITGATQINGATGITGALTLNTMPVFAPAAIDVAVTSPTIAGQIARTADYDLYIASGPGVVAAWKKITN